MFMCCMSALFPPIALIEAKHNFKAVGDAASAGPRHHPSTFLLFPATATALCCTDRTGTQCCKNHPCAGRFQPLCAVVPLPGFTKGSPAQEKKIVTQPPP
jgi:hypothetical protein